MDPLKELLAQASLKRNRSIIEAERKFYEALLLAANIERPPYEPERRRGPRPGTPIHAMKTIHAARAILREGKPMTLVELGVELQFRGHRSNDMPRLLMRSIYSAFRYHPNEFILDAEGRWTIN